MLVYVWQSYFPKLGFMGDTAPDYPIWDRYFTSWVGRFGWGDYGFPRWVSSVTLVVLVALLAGAVALAVRHRAAMRARAGEWLTYAALALGLLGLLGYTGYGYWRDTAGNGFEQGRYLLPLLALYGGLVAAGVRGLGDRWGRPAGALLVVAALSCSVWAQLLTIAPLVRLVSVYNDLPMSVQTSPRETSRRQLIRERWDVLALTGLLILGTVALILAGRRTGFYFDEWNFVQDRRAWTADALLLPHNEHLSLVPVLVYKLLFATVGISDYLPYRLCIIALHLLVVVLLFVYARRRVGSLIALLCRRVAAVPGAGVHRHRVAVPDRLPRLARVRARRAAGARPRGHARRRDRVRAADRRAVLLLARDPAVGGGRARVARPPGAPPPVADPDRPGRALRALVRQLLRRELDHARQRVRHAALRRRGGRGRDRGDRRPRSDLGAHPARAGGDRAVLVGAQPGHGPVAPRRAGGRAARVLGA